MIVIVAMVMMMLMVMIAFIKHYSPVSWRIHYRILFTITDVFAYRL